MVSKKKSKLPLIDVIFANRKNTLVFALVMLGISFYLVESAGTFEWSEIVWVFVILLAILFISGRKQLEETNSELTHLECFERIFGEGGHLEILQKSGRFKEGKIKPTGVWATNKLEGKTAEYEFGYLILDEDGIGEEWSMAIDPKNGIAGHNLERPEGFTGRNKIKYRLHPESVLERKKYLKDLEKDN